LTFQVIEQTIANFTEKLRSRKAAQTLDIVRHFTPLQYSTMQCHSVCDLWIVDSEAALSFLGYHVECLPYFSIYMRFSQHVELHHSIYEHCDSLGFNSAFHPSGVAKWVPASAGKAKQLWFIPLADIRGCAGKTVRSLENACHTSAP